MHAYTGIYVGHAVRNRLFREAVIWIARAGAPWHQWPSAYGKWNSVYRRFAHGCERGVWPRLMAHLQAKPELSAGLLDSTVVRAHASAPTQKGADPALGCGRGGRSAQIPYPGGSTGSPLCVRLTGGQRHDSTQARDLVKAWTGAPLPCLIADRAYDGEAFRAWMAQRAFGPSCPRVPGVWIPTLRPGSVPNAQRGQTRLRLAQGVAARGHPLRPIRPLLPGFSVPGRDLDRLKLNPHGSDSAGVPDCAGRMLDLPCRRLIPSITLRTVPELAAGSVAPWRNARDEKPRRRQRHSRLPTPS